MVTTSEILSTLKMIDREKLDVRTITMGISLLSCVTDDEDRLCGNIYDLITRRAERLVAVGQIYVAYFHQFIGIGVDPLPKPLFPNRAGYRSPIHPALTSFTYIDAKTSVMSHMTAGNFHLPTSFWVLYQIKELGARVTWGLLKWLSNG